MQNESTEQENGTAAGVQIEPAVVLRYSPSAPTKPGWYWIKSEYVGNGIVEVFVRPGHKYLCISNPSCCQHTKRDFLYVGQLGAEWAGPICEAT